MWWWWYRPASRPGRFTLGEIVPGTPWIGIWACSRAGLDVVEKMKNLSTCRNSKPGRPARSP
jgi:hypothetical protein